MFIAITGPTGVGKTTVSEKLAKELPRSVNINLDTVKHFVVNGFIYNDSDEGKQQWKLLGKNAARLVQNFLAEGYAVVVNGMVGEETWDEICAANEPNLKVLLVSKREVNISRDKHRSEQATLGEQKVREHHDYFDTAKTEYFKGWTALDTSTHTPEETVRSILSLIAK